MLELKDLRSTKNPHARIKIMEGHFATSNSHVNLYIDMSTIKCRHQNARETAKEFVEYYQYNTVLDTIICLEGMDMVAGFMAEMLADEGIRSINVGKNISVLSPPLSSSGQYIFNESVQRMVRNMRTLILCPSVTTGNNAERAAQAVRYYGGKVVGIAAIFSNIEKTGDDIPIFSIFEKSDLPDYQAYEPSECPMCRQGRPLDALVSGMGYNRL